MFRVFRKIEAGDHLKIVAIEAFRGSEEAITCLKNWTIKYPLEIVSMSYSKG